MASTTTSATSGLVSPALADAKTTLRAQATHSVSLPALPPSANVASTGQLPSASYCKLHCTLMYVFGIGSYVEIIQIVPK